MNRALLIGINECDGADALAGPHDDVARFGSFLVNACGFQERSCARLTDPDATHDAMAEAIEQLIGDTAADDGSTCVLYYSGHGCAQRFGKALAAKGIVRAPGVYSMILACDWGGLPKRGVNSDQFKRMTVRLEGSDSRIVAIFDCCQIGGMHIDQLGRVKGVKNPDVDPSDYATIQPFGANLPGGIGITACAMNETTLDVDSLPSSGFPGPGGAFSMFFLSELQRSPLQPVAQICNRVEQRLSQSGSQQTPSAYPPEAAAAALPLFT